MARASRLRPRKALGAAGVFAHSRCEGTKSRAEVLPRRDVLNFRFLSPENISCPRGRLKVARGGKGVLGAGFSIAGEGGDMLVGGKQGTFCAARCSLPQLRTGSRVVFLQLHSCLLSLP